MMYRLLVLCLLLLCSCGPAKPRLYIYTWADYIKPELIEQFEKEHNCIVIVDTFDSNESMFAKLLLAGSGYDIIVPSNYFLELMQNRDMLQLINREALPALKDLDPKIAALVGADALRYGVPYMMTPTGVAWRKDKQKDFHPSWAVFNDSALKGRMTMLSDPREALGAALKYLGFSANTENLDELKAAKEQLISWKRNLAKFESEQYKNGIASGEYLVVQGYSGDVLQVMSENSAVEFAIPQEGTTTSIDFMVIPKQAQSVALAHEFINFLFDSKQAAENMNFTCYLCPNVAALDDVNDLLKPYFTSFLSDQSLEKVELIKDLGPVTSDYIHAWDEVKSS